MFVIIGVRGEMTYHEMSGRDVNQTAKCFSSDSLRISPSVVNVCIIEGGVKILTSKGLEFDIKMALLFRKERKNV
jgi:hypothetical protein